MPIPPSPGSSLNCRGTTTTSAIAAQDDRQADRGPGSAPQGVGDRAEAGRCQPHRRQDPDGPGRDLQQHRSGAVAVGQAVGGVEAQWKALAIRQRLVDANPAVTQFQGDLGWCHEQIGDSAAADR